MNMPIINNRVIRDELAYLLTMIRNGDVSYNDNEHIFVFICGANKNENEISTRRKAIIDFAKTNLPNIEFLLAEKVFEFLKIEDNKQNLLDIEHTISDFSDFILIVLESYSAFAELGAFSKTDLLQKLIVINNSKYAHSASFINLGPINLIQSQPSKDRVILYPMGHSVTEPDPIASTFSPLSKILTSKTLTRSKRLKIEQISDLNKISKLKVMFIHDLIYLTGHINRKSLISILESIMGRNDYKILTRYLGLLCSFEFITQRKAPTADKIIYHSNRSAPYFEYKKDVTKIITAFRIYNQKAKPESIYGT